MVISSRFWCNYYNASPASIVGQFYIWGREIYLQLCILWWRFDWQHPFLLQGGGFDLARAVPKFLAAEPHLNKATLSSIVGIFICLRPEQGVLNVAKCRCKGKDQWSESTPKLGIVWITGVNELRLTFRINFRFQRLKVLWMRLVIGSSCAICYLICVCRLGLQGKRAVCQTSGLSSPPTHAPPPPLTLDY